MESASTLINYDEMTIDQKKKLVQDYKHEPFKVGTFVDATDTT